MGARQRLNSLYLFGVLIVAAIFGVVVHSWGVFLLVAGTLTSLLLHGGDIRPTPSSPPQRHRPRRSRRNERRRHR